MNIIRMMKFNNLTVGIDGWSNGVCIFLAITILLIMGGAIYLLIRFSLKEHARYHEEKNSYIEGVLSKQEIFSNINTYISKSTLDTPFTLVMLDIDKFTKLTNAFGDKIASEVIKVLVSKFDKALSFQVQMGRLEKDAFLFFFKAEYSLNEVMQITNKIKEIFDTPIKVGISTEVSITASLGICQFPRHGRTITQLLESLSIAVYTAKREGGDKIVVYSEEMNDNEASNVQYYEQVKSAIDNNEFVLYYQPIIDTWNKKIVAVEGLIRWEHKELGIINPNEFLHILEQSGDIYWVGLWVLETIVQEYNQLKARYPRKEIVCTINLSQKQLMNERLTSDFVKILKKYKTNSKEIVIELEEFLMYETKDVVHHNIKKLRELGFKIAVDGFNLDYNRIIKMDQLPIDYIKLDASFLDEDNYEIMRHYIDLLVTYAEKQNITIIAEKVENLETIKYFRNQKINIVQGYYLAKSMSEQDLYDFIDHESIIEDRLSTEDLKDEKLISDEIEEKVEQDLNSELNNINSDIDDNKTQEEQQ